MAAEQAAIHMAVQQALNTMLPTAMATTMATVQASLDQLMAGVQGTADRLNNAETNIAKVGNAVDQITTQWAARLDDLEGDMVTIAAETKGTANDVETANRALLNKLNAEFSDSKDALTKIVAEARG